MSEKVTVKKVYANTTKKGGTYYNAYLQEKEGSFTTWDKITEGESYSVDIWQDGKYMKMKVVEDIPDKDVHSDLVEPVKPTLTTNHSIESQVVLKGTVDIICTLIGKDLLNETNIEANITLISAKLTEELKNTQKTLLTPDETTELEPF